MALNYQDVTIHQLIEKQVYLTPEQLAVSFQNQHLTYQKLNEKANQLAHYLQSLGVGSETLVGICIDRSEWMVICLLAVLKAGGAYVPLDPAYPAERLWLMIEDSQLLVLLTQQHLVAKITAHSAKVVVLDSEVITEYSHQNPINDGDADSLAYVIYTSGSTGKPKGVEVLHGAVVNCLVAMQQQPGLTSQDNVLATTTISFDIAVLEMLFPLTVGASVVIVSNEVVANPLQLSQAIDHSGATIIQGTPSTWRMLLAVGWEGHQNLKILCGGEPLTRPLANQLLERSAEVWNLYGITETTIWSTVHRVEAGDRPIPIGQPICNTQLYIFKEPARRKYDTLQPVSGETEGQLYIGGMGLARGYRHRPQLTAEKFIRHPFSDDPTARLYRTGDLARYLPDGNIEVMGRIDHQVKLRGHRIELGDIEATLLQHPQVKESVAVVREYASGDLYLVAYAVLASQLTNIHPVELRAWLKGKLPDYMLPAIVVLLESLPLTPNCKVDRRALPSPTQDVMVEFNSLQPELEVNCSSLAFS